MESEPKPSHRPNPRRSRCFTLFSSHEGPISISLWRRLLLFRGERVVYSVRTRLSRNLAAENRCRENSRMVSQVETPLLHELLHWLVYLRVSPPRLTGCSLVRLVALKPESGLDGLRRTPSHGGSDVGVLPFEFSVEGLLRHYLPLFVVLWYQKVHNR